MASALYDKLTYTIYIFLRLANIPLSLCSPLNYLQWLKKRENFSIWRFGRKQVHGGVQVYSKARLHSLHNLKQAPDWCRYRPAHKNRIVVISYSVSNQNKLCALFLIAVWINKSKSCSQDIMKLRDLNDNTHGNISWISPQTFEVGVARMMVFWEVTPCCFYLQGDWTSFWSILKWYEWRVPP